MLHQAITLSNKEITRYSRHLVLPEIGMAGQLKLKNAKVILIGVGGLGAPLGMYLAAAGVGTIGLVDFDKIEFSNLQRQLIFGTQDVGRPKLEAAKEKLLGINPEININTYDTKLTSKNALELLKDYDIVADGTDNFPTRYLVNDACTFLGKPNVHGSILRFDGQVTVFYPPKGACYRCLYPKPPPPNLVPSCAEGGVLGVLPGIIGSMQAIEVIKLIVGIGNSLINRLIVFDALRMAFTELKLKQNPSCPLCGKNPAITKLIDYEEYCTKTDKEQAIDVLELKRRMDAKEDLFILDVRETYEHEICKISPYLIPLKELPKNIHKLNPSNEIIVYCKSGMRSQKAVEILKQAGFTKIKHLIGGIDAWADRIEHLMPRY